MFDFLGEESRSGHGLEVGTEEKLQPPASPAVPGRWRACEVARARLAGAKLASTFKCCDKALSGSIQLHQPPLSMLAIWREHVFSVSTIDCQHKIFVRTAARRHVRPARHHNERYQRPDKSTLKQNHTQRLIITPVYHEPIRKHPPIYPSPSLLDQKPPCGTHARPALIVKDAWPNSATQHHRHDDLSYVALPRAL